MSTPPDPSPYAPGEVGASLFRLAIRRPVAVTMISLGVLIFGAVAYQRLEVALLPRFSHPTLTVRTAYPGSAPGEVEQFVTAPLEAQLSVASGLVELRSLSRPGLSEIVLEYQWDTSMALAALEVREKLDRIAPVDGVEPSQILRFSPEDEPIVRLALAGEQPLSVLRQLAEEEIEPALLALAGVAAVQVRGGAPPEVLVELDEGRVTRLGLSVAQVSMRLAEESINLAGGVLEDGRLEYRVRTLSELTTLEEIGDVLLSGPAGPPVRLRDVATIRMGTGEVRVRARSNGHPAVEIEVYKEADANVVEVSRRVRQRIRGGREASGDAGGRSLRAMLPPETGLRVVYDQSRFIVLALDEMRRTALMGGLLAMAVLLLFLGEFRSTLFIAVAIPLSILATFLPMFLGGVTLNLISMGGLALGMGMLVDNSIVVLEAIHRLREQGLDRFQAALRGVEEVGGAVTASTLTTVAVFLPMAFVEGVAGQIVGDLALTIVFSLLASLAVSVLVLPMLTVVLGPAVPDTGVLDASGTSGMGASIKAGGLSGSTRNSGGGPLREGWRSWKDDWSRIYRKSSAPLPLWIGLLPYQILHSLLTLALLGLGAGCWFLLRGLLGVLRSTRRIFPPLLSPFGFLLGGFQSLVSLLVIRYRALLERVLRAPSRWLALTGLLLVAALWFGWKLPQELIPQLHQGVLLTRLEMPPGTALRETVERVGRIERGLAALPLVESTFARIGAERDDPVREQGGDHVGLVWVSLQPGPDIASREERVMAQIREKLRGEPGLTYRIGQPLLFTLKPPLSVELGGESLADLDDLAEAADRVERRLRKLPMLVDVKSRQTRGTPELQIRFDREQLSRHGLSAREVAEEVRRKLQGETPLQFRSLGKRVDVRVRMSRPQLNDITKLENVIVNPGQAVPIPLKAVATVWEGAGPSEIRRISQRRSAQVTASLRGVNLKGAQEEIRAALRGMSLPEGIRYSLGGQGEEMRRSIDSLLFALALAVFLVYLVLAAQFESFVQPVIVLCAVPLAVAGVGGSLWVLGQSLNMLVGLGLIVLIGIVVNNAIVLTTTLNRLREEGMPLKKAIVQAGAMRLRPILMTTLTTILGLLPLVLSTGPGAEVRLPIALTIITGLLTSMVLTLVIIPAACAVMLRGNGAR